MGYVWRTCADAWTTTIGDSYSNIWSTQIMGYWSSHLQEIEITYYCLDPKERFPLRWSFTHFFLFKRFHLNHMVSWQESAPSATTSSSQRSVLITAKRMDDAQYTIVSILWLIWVGVTQHQCTQKRTLFLEIARPTHDKEEQILKQMRPRLMESRLTLSNGQNYEVKGSYSQTFRIIWLITGESSTVDRSLWLSSVWEFVFE